MPGFAGLLQMPADPPSSRFRSFPERPFFITRVMPMAGRRERQSLPEQTIYTKCLRVSASFQHALFRIPTIGRSRVAIAENSIPIEQRLRPAYPCLTCAAFPANFMAQHGVSPYLARMPRHAGPIFCAQGLGAPLAQIGLQSTVTVFPACALPRRNALTISAKQIYPCGLRI